MQECCICHTQGAHANYLLKEMMFGTREKFPYFKCKNCGCMQIEEIPKDLSVFYQKDYYSLKEIKTRFLVRRLRKIRSKHSLGHKSLIGYILTLKHGQAPLTLWLKESSIQKASKILDVGCGAGELLLQLSDLGYNNLTGLDPYIEKDLEFSNGVRIYKKELHELKGSFDFIMLNHVFENLPKPDEYLSSLYNLLNEKGTLLLRIPIVNSFAWKKYKENWIQLDPPRHLFIYSIQSLEILAERNSFSIEKIIYDSTALQFWGSEQYLNDIPLNDSRSYDVSKQSSLFSRDQLKTFSKKSIQLNKEKQGDQACFFLKKSDVIKTCT